MHLDCTVKIASMPTSILDGRKCTIYSLNMTQTKSSYIMGDSLMIFLEFGLEVKVKDGKTIREILIALNQESSNGKLASYQILLTF